MKRAKQEGFRIELYFLCLQEPEMNVERVHTRVEGNIGTGHNVPTDKIVSRYPRSLGLLSQSFVLADEAMVYNNSWEKPTLLAHKTNNGKVHIYPLHDKDKRSKWTKLEIEKLIGIQPRLPARPPLRRRGTQDR